MELSGERSDDVLGRRRRARVRAEAGNKYEILRVLTQRPFAVFWLFVNFRYFIVLLVWFYEKCQFEIGLTHCVICYFVVSIKMHANYTLRVELTGIRVMHRPILAAALLECLCTLHCAILLKGRALMLTLPCRFTDFLSGHFPAMLCFFTGFPQRWSELFENM